MDHHFIFRALAQQRALKNKMNEIEMRTKFDHERNSARSGKRSAANLLCSTTLRPDGATRGAPSETKLGVGVSSESLIITWFILIAINASNFCE